MKCCSVVFSVTLRLLVTHFVVLSRHQQLRSFAYRDYSVVNLSRFVAAECSALTARTVYSTRLSQANWLGIAISAHPPLEGRGGDSRRNIAMTFGMEKLECCGHPMVKKNENMFIHFDRIGLHERDRQTSGRRRTPHDGIGRALA